MSTATSNLIPVMVPSVGESITSGVIGSWKKKNGDSVAAGDPLFEIETDKVTSEVFAETSGTLEILVAEGTEVKVGQVVANILPVKGPGKPSGAAPVKPAADSKVGAVVPNRPIPPAKPSVEPRPTLAKNKATKSKPSRVSSRKRNRKPKRKNS